VTTCRKLFVILTKCEGTHDSQTACWFPDLKGGKFIVVVVVADPSPADRY